VPEFNGWSWFFLNGLTPPPYTFSPLLPHSAQEIDTPSPRKSILDAVSILLVSIAHVFG
jgi:hypothetical protein